MTTIQYWDCLECGQECQRKSVRGQRPKFCGVECGRRYNEYTKLQGLSYTCYGCKDNFTPKDYRDKYCTYQCSVAHRPRKAPNPKPEVVDRRSPIRKAYESKDRDALLEAIRAECKRVDDCWVWHRSVDTSGYPRVTIAGQRLSVHRLVVETYHGKPLGTQHAHHTCANTVCVNPKHVVPVTAAQNIAEMNARQSYIARIKELENALAELAPYHPALGVIELY